MTSYQNALEVALDLCAPSAIADGELDEELKGYIRGQAELITYATRHGFEDNDYAKATICLILSGGRYDG